MADRDIIARLRLAGEEFSRELKTQFDKVPQEAQRAGNEAGTRFASGFSLKAAGLAAAGASAFALVSEAVGKSLDLAKDLDVMSKQAGVSAEKLQELRFAASQLGVEAGRVDDALTGLTQKIGEAASGNREAQRAFVDLGVSFEKVDGQGRSTSAVFTDVIQRLSEIQNPAERARLGSQLLGEEFARLEPLARGGAAGLNQAALELRELHAVLTEDEIRNLQVTNAKLDAMKTVLSVKIADVVSDNSDAILRLAGSLASLASWAIKAADGYLRFNSAVNQRSSEIYKINANPNLNADQKAAARKQLDQRLGFKDEEVNPGWGWLTVHKSKYTPPSKGVDFFGIGKVLDAAQQARDYAANSGIAPLVDPKPVRAKKVRGGARAKASGDTEAERDAKRAWEDEKRLREAIEDTIRSQQDSVRVEQVRAQQGEVAAAEEEARLGFERQHPEVLAQTTAELAKMLGIQGELKENQSAQLETDLQRLKLAQQGAVDAAGKAERDKQHEEVVRMEKEAEQELQRLREDNVRELAGLYEDLFSGGVDKIWKDFKSIGLRVVSEVAAQWTLAQISGQSFNAGQAMQTGFSSSPLGSLFGGLFGGGSSSGKAANDNSGESDFEAAFKDIGLPSGWTSEMGSSAGGEAASGLGSIGAGIQVGVMAGSISDEVLDLIGIKSSGTGAMAGGIAGSFIAGPLGAVIGSVLGGIVGGLFKKTKKGISTIGGSGDALSILSTRGNSSSREQASIDMGGSVIDSIQQIADALGADVDASLGSVSIGVRKKSYRVDPTGGGNTKTSKGAIDFGDDQQAAIEAAVKDLISDGVITGISQASLNIIKKSADLEKAIEKAALIESVPKLLKQRLDPLGYALDEIDDKFRKLADALKEGGASADQIAQARQLWQLEREDTIKQIGAASATLKDFLQSLSVGSNSPLSLRQQEAAAREALTPYEQQIEAAKAAQAEVDRLKASGGTDAQIKAAEDAARIAAGKIDQDAFTAAAQQLLEIERAMNGSSGNFFTEFDRIRQLTGVAADLIDAVTTSTGAAGTDPFSSVIAANTGDAANILADQSALLNGISSQLTAMNDNLATLFGRAPSWILDQRGYA